jgi:alpha-D-xyloside xylohydrolase
MELYFGRQIYCRHLKSLRQWYHKAFTRLSQEFHGGATLAQVCASHVLLTRLLASCNRTTDVGGYFPNKENHSPYMQELIVRWYQFGTFCPIFRTHGCRTCKTEPSCQQEPDVSPCTKHPGGPPLQASCAANEVWSYGNGTQVHLEKWIRVRAQLKPYIAELSFNVTARGVPTMRPLWFGFPNVPKCLGVNDQYLLGPDLLVAPVTVQNATSRSVYFPAGSDWQSFFDPSAAVVKGGSRQMVQAPLDIIPVYWRKASAAVKVNVEQ